eukprot:7572867-Ditylum_brightwellii.AAC.1
MPSSAKKRVKGKEITHENVFPLKKKALLSCNQVAFLQDVIRYRDNNNNGMTRKDVITTIAEIGRVKLMEQANNHLNYLIRRSRLEKIKREGQ